MPHVVNVRPEAIDLDYYPGNPVTLTFTFPAGYLATVTFKSFLNGRGDGGVEGVCTEDGDVLTVEFDLDATLAYSFPVGWELDLFTLGSFPDPDIYLPQFVGTWTPGREGDGGPVAADFTVSTPSEVSVTVQSANLPGPPGADGTDGTDGTDGADGVVLTIQEGSNITVDSTDPANPIVSATGASLADGGYGDVSVTGGGAVITIEADAVTNAKMADMTAATFKGRALGAGTGNPTDLTASQLRTGAGLVIGTDVAAATEPIAAAHIADTTDAHDASAISFSPSGTISSTDVQAAVLEAASEAGTAFVFTLNAQTGTTYTPVIGDLNKLVTQSNASPITTSLPQNSDVAFAIGTQINFLQIGAGQVTFAAGTGATVNGTPGLKLRDQYSLATAVKVSTNGWVVVGDLAA